MWRRVSCEQPLNTSQSILRLRGNLNQACGVFLRETATWPKGNLVLIPKTWTWNRFGISYSVVATRHDWETPTEALGRVVFSA